MTDHKMTFAQRREQMWNTAVMLEKLSHAVHAMGDDAKKGADFLTEEVARMNDAMEKFSKRAERRATRA